MGSTEIAMRVRTASRGFRPGVLALLVAVATEAHAVGEVSLSWDNCSPIVSAKSSDGAHPYSAFLSVIGQSEAHVGYQCFVHLSTLPPGSGPLRDAWRFDLAGCQGPSLLPIHHLPPTALAKACPAFAGAGEVLAIKDFSYDLTSGRARVVIAISYPTRAVPADPNVRYFLGRMEFDHTYSVVGEGEPGQTCGGFEQDLQISLLPGCLDPRFCTPNVSWLDVNRNEHDFAIADPTLTFCGSCGPTPATRSTWGEIKGRYRH